MQNTGKRGKIRLYDNFLKGKLKMEEIKNKIITISGEPVSGKGTVVKLLVEKYQKMGYNVHVIETGKVFRELAQKEYMKMYPERKDSNISEIQKD